MEPVAIRQIIRGGFKVFKGRRLSRAQVKQLEGKVYGDSYSLEASEAAKRIYELLNRNGTCGSEASSPLLTTSDSSDDDSILSNF